MYPPTVILVHGEAHNVNFKDVGQYVSLGKLAAASGLNAVTFNHRVLSDGFTIEEVNSDVNQLLKYLIANADKLKIDKGRIGIWCFSGDVPFSLYAGINSFSHCVKCIAAYYGIADFKVAKNNLTVDVYNHSTGGHAFDLFNDNKRTCEIIAKTLDFFKKHLG